MSDLSPPAALSRQGPGETEGAASCGGCAGDCCDACFSDAIVWSGGSGIRIAEDLCAGCGACVAACGRHLLQIVGGVVRSGARQP